VYAAEDIPVKKQTRKTHKQTKLRASITPGTVLILLSGRFKGKRVVFLKQLSSGLLLVTGPHKINGVPLRRVNQAYVIATSTKLDVKADVAHIDDAYFAVKKSEKAKPTADQLFGEGREKSVVSEQRLKDQKAVDKVVIAAVKKTTGLKQYLNASFALSKGQYPHALKF
jgi:large subunit ribosomal protein L6e